MTRLIKGKCGYCPFPGFFAAKGNRFCYGCYCELCGAKGQMNNKTLDEY